MTSYDYMIIRFYDIIIAFFLDTSSNDHIKVRVYGFVYKKKPLKFSKKLKKKPCILIGKKPPKLNKKIRKKTWAFDQYKTSYI